MVHFFYFLKTLGYLILFQFFQVLKAQQNYINVPSTDATSINKVFFQQQFNFNELIQSNTTIDYGIGDGFEAGINILGLNFNESRNTFFKNDSDDRDPYNPLLLLNTLKTFKLNPNASLGVGAQLGLNFDLDKKYSRAGLSYLNFRYDNLFLKNSSVVLGAYYNSLHYGGEGNRIGAWLATEVPLTHSFHLVLESIIGHNAISYSSIGTVYYLSKNYVLTLGLQIPNTSKNAYSMVFEFTYVPN